MTFERDADVLPCLKIPARHSIVWVFPPSGNQVTANYGNCYAAAFTAKNFVEAAALRTQGYQLKLSDCLSPVPAGC
jgi:hypothetical protein